MYLFQPDNTAVRDCSLLFQPAIGFGASIVFYNSYLPEIAAEKDQDHVSAKGFAMGILAVLSCNC